MDIAQLNVEINSGQVNANTVAMHGMRTESKALGAQVDSTNAKQKTGAQVINDHTAKVQNATRVYKEFKQTIGGLTFVYMVAQLVTLSKTFANVDGAMTKLMGNDFTKGAFRKAFEDINKQLGITRGLTSVIDFLADHMTVLLKVVMLLALTAIPGLIGAIIRLGTIIGGAVAAINPIVLAIVAAIAIVVLFKDKLGELADYLGKLADNAGFKALGDMLHNLASLLNGIPNLGKATDNVKALTEEQKAFMRQLNESTKALQAQINVYKGGYKGASGGTVISLGQNARDAALQQAKDLADARNKLLGVKIDPNSQGGLKLSAQLVQMAEAQRELNAAVDADNSLDDQQQLNQALKVGGLAYDEMNRKIAAQNTLRSAGVDITSANGQALLAEMVSTQKLAYANDQLITKMQNLKDIATGTGQALSSGFENVLFKVNSLRQGISNLALDISKLIFEQTAGSYISKAVSGFLGNAMGVGVGQDVNSLSTVPGTFFSAKGNVFAGGQGGPQIMKFAQGGVLGSQATFGMAGGNVGVAGEVPGSFEGIVPLARDASGKLGVHSKGGAGGAVHVHNNFYTDATGADSAAIARLERMQRSQADNFAKMAVTAVVDARKKQPRLFGGKR